MRERDLAAALLAGWTTALEAIPDAWIDRCFAGAVRAHRGAFTLAYGEVLDVWDGLMTERKAPPPAAVPDVPFCETCQGRVFVIGTRDGMMRCPECRGATAPPSAAPAEYRVQHLLIVLRAFCTEHTDKTIPALCLLRYALACAGAGLYAENLRGLLESVENDSLYATLCFLGIAVDPPPDPTQGPPSAPPAGWAGAGQLLSTAAPEAR